MDSVTLSGPEYPPAAGGKPKHLVILLHGLGSDGQDLIGLAPLLGAQLPHTHFISPNAHAACDMSPGGYQWFSLRDWSPMSMLRGAQEAAPILNLFIDAQLKRHGLSDDKFALVGFSQGTMMSLYTALRRPKACAAVVGFSGALIGENGITAKPPVCLIHGQDDMVVPFGAMALAEAMLTHEGITVETHARRGLGHGIDPAGLQIAAAFLKSKLA
jgi:phospholipase/carboxylesterase